MATPPQDGVGLVGIKSTTSCFLPLVPSPSSGMPGSRKAPGTRPTFNFLLMYIYKVTYFVFHEVHCRKGLETAIYLCRACHDTLQLPWGPLPIGKIGTWTPSSHPSSRVGLTLRSPSFPIPISSHLLGWCCETHTPENKKRIALNNRIFICARRHRSNRKI